MIAIIAEFAFNTRLGKWTLAMAAFAAIFTAWLVRHDGKVAARAEQKVIQRSEKAGEIAGKKSEKEHARASKDGAAERLLRSSCRDCD